MRVGAAPPKAIAFFVMDVKGIKSIKQCQQFCEGVVNDFESGVSDKKETMQALYEYTMHLHDFFSKQVNKIKNKTESDNE
ncbi:hypothetical protein B620_gp48 [Croceibacter phage P2559S]|uniref:hypothetical protein n=1 Tax=Croceibacter phage P2559S TaxID=1176422 RepID=UPI0002688ECB|nr:hypothetical protein B620_gp48 [Croceibacter phage P2559S]AFM54826.1 hypothetical protein P2559S_48 [Croceibacter phage P2559S]